MESVKNVPNIQEPKEMDGSVRQILVHQDKELKKMEHVKIVQNLRKHKMMVYHVTGISVTKDKF